MLIILLLYHEKKPLQIITVLPEIIFKII